MANRGEMLLWLRDARGIYIPRDFANSFADRAKHVRGVSDEDWAILEAGPDHEQYWDAWQDVCDNAKITDDNDIEYFVYQNGDCWLVPVGMDWSDDGDMFQWPSDDSDSPIEVDEITMPSHWACALINGDTSGMDDAEIDAMETYVKETLYDEGWRVVDVKEGSERFTASYGSYGGDAEGGEVADYIIHRDRA